MLDGGLARRDDSAAPPEKSGGWAMASRAKAPLWRETMKEGARRSVAVIAGAALFLGVAALVLALLTYHAQDPSLDTASGGPALTLFGGFGAWIADLLLALLGWPVV